MGPEGRKEVGDKREEKGGKREEGGGVRKEGDRKYKPCPAESEFFPSQRPEAHISHIYGTIIVSGMGLVGEDAETVVFYIKF